MIPSSVRVVGVVVPVDFVRRLEGAGEVLLEGAILHIRYGISSRNCVGPGWYGTVRDLVRAAASNFSQCHLESVAMAFAVLSNECRRSRIERSKFGFRARRMIVLYGDSGKRDLQT